MKKKVFILLFILAGLGAHAQILYLKKGSQLPHFTFNDVAHYPKSKINLNEFKGRWLLIQCWNVGSGEMSYWDPYLTHAKEIMQRYSGQVQCLVIAYTGSQYVPSRGATLKVMKESYENRGLKFPVAYDSTFFHRFDIGACPFMIVVDPKGVIRAITTDVRAADMGKFLGRRVPKLSLAYRTHEEGSTYLYFKRNRAMHITTGEECPNYTFKDVRYNPQTSVDIKDFRGEWLILDCWNAQCSSCITSMPKIDSMRKIFAGKARVLLVGYTGSQYDNAVDPQGPDDKRIRALYEEIRTEQHLNLPVAYDSTFFHHYDIGTCPYIVVVDPSGVVRGVTTFLTINNVNTFLAGKQPVLPKADRYHEKGQPFTLESWGKINRRH